MCGRFTLSTAAEILAALFRLRGLPEGLTPRYNIAPTQPVLVLAGDRSGEAEWMRWGFEPPWRPAEARGVAAPLINARSETVDRKPVFSEALRRRRCVVLADGFYEWQRRGGRSEPWLFRLRAGGAFAFAGLWQPSEQRSAATPRGACVILTTDASPDVTPVHGRMPVILGPDGRSAWLAPGVEGTTALRQWLRPLPAEALVAQRVSHRVNSAAHDDVGCIAAAEPKGTGDSPASHPDRPRKGAPAQLSLWDDW